MLGHLLWECITHHPLDGDLTLLEFLGVSQRQFQSVTFPLADDKIQ